MFAYEETAGIVVSMHQLQQGNQVMKVVKYFRSPNNSTRSTKVRDRPWKVR